MKLNLKKNDDQTKDFTIHYNFISPKIFFSLLFGSGRLFPLNGAFTVLDRAANLLTAVDNVILIQT